MGNMIKKVYTRANKTKQKKGRGGVKITSIRESASITRNNKIDVLLSNLKFWLKCVGPPLQHFIWYLNPKYLDFASSTCFTHGSSPFAANHYNLPPSPFSLVWVLVISFLFVSKMFSLGPVHSYFHPLP